MKSKLLEHILSIVFVTLMLAGLVYLTDLNQKTVQEEKQAGIQDFIDLPFTDFNDPFHRALLGDVMNIFYPEQPEENSITVKALITYKQNVFLDDVQKSHVTEGLSFGRVVQIIGMYIKFILVYILVMALTFYGVQTLGAWRFVRKKHISYSEKIALSFRQPKTLLITGLGTFAKAVAYLVLFSPAYVIAYSIRTDFNTDTVLFMVLLGVVSNGLLVTYANKFYAFLTAESRKGYVETAMVKNLNNDYSPQGIALKTLLKPVKRFEGHVFNHVFQNAHLQYLATLKEQAAFLITGLIIIEMALNIHGHLSYEMLRQLLYRNYAIVILIILCIFYTVKFTEIFTDWLVQRNNAKYENK
jgi:hypothetical protein